MNDLRHRVGVGAPVEQEPGDLEVAVMRRLVEPRHPVLQGRAARKGAGGPREYFSFFLGNTPYLNI